MNNTIDVATSNDYLLDLLALLDMYKAMAGMIERFDMGQNNQIWARQLEEYHDTIQAYYQEYKHLLTAQDMTIFLAQNMTGKGVDLS